MSCLLLYHETVSTDIIIDLLKALFQAEDYEIKVCKQNTVQILLWNVDRGKIHEAITSFEIENIITTHGFAKDDIQASEKAWQILLQKQRNHSNLKS